MIPDRTSIQYLIRMLFLDEVYEVTPDGTRLRFQWIREPTSARLTQLAQTIARRAGRLLERDIKQLETERDRLEPNVGANNALVAEARRLLNAHGERVP